MNRKLILKFTVDFIMTVLLLLLMSFRLTDDTIHEILGISIFILFLIHSVLNIKWYLSIFKGKYNTTRILKTVINLLLALIILVMLVNAVYVSQSVFRFIPVDSTLFVIELHMFFAAWGFVLIAVHLGMHLKMILNVVGLVTVSKSYIILLRISALFLLLFGIKASIDRYLFQKLLMYPAYDSISLTGTGIEILGDYLLIMGMIVTITYYSLHYSHIQEKKHS